MKLTHHGLQVELPDEWWIEAKMMEFVPRSVAYRVDHNLFENMREVRIEDVGPGHRNPGVGTLTLPKRNSASSAYDGASQRGISEYARAGPEIGQGERK